MKNFIKVNWEYLFIFSMIIFVATFSAFKNRENYAPDFVVKKIYINGGYAIIMYERNYPQNFQVISFK